MTPISFEFYPPKTDEQRAQLNRTAERLARYAPDLAKPLQTLQVATLRARGLASGYPKLAVDAGGAWLAWTDVGEDGVAQLKGARITR